jgi:transcriptional regulator GlxA family with amidase domain
VSGPPATFRVGAVLFPGFELLDVFGPLEMFGALGSLGGDAGQVEISMLAERPGAVPSYQGPASLADSSLADARELDVLLVPGGQGTRREVSNAALIGELGRRCAGARMVASVCTGSALLAKAGVLDGLSATTNKRAFGWVASQGPGVRWIAKARWVEDGKFFTSSGVSAGIDMALGLIARLYGRDASVAIARRTEYEWHEDRGWDPFAALCGLA